MKCSEIQFSSFLFSSSGGENISKQFFSRTFMSHWLNALRKSQFWNFAELSDLNGRNLISFWLHERAQSQVKCGKFVDNLDLILIKTFTRIVCNDVEFFDEKLSIKLAIVSRYHSLSEFFFLSFMNTFVVVCVLFLFGLIKK